MSEEVKFIITTVVAPLIGGVFTLAVFIFNSTVAHLRKEVKDLKDELARNKAEVEKDCDKCNLELKSKIEHNSKNIGKLFDENDKSMTKIIKVSGRIDTIEAECRLRHNWDGSDRRK